MNKYFKKILILILLFLISFSLTSCEFIESFFSEDETEGTVVTYFDGYYSSLISWTDGEDLKRQLNSIIAAKKVNGNYIKQYNVAGYKGNWIFNDHGDRAFDDKTKVNVVYSEYDVRAGYDSNNSHDYNREHAWPQSMMKVNKVNNDRTSDFHNIFASNSSANSSRGNSYFGYLYNGSKASGSTDCYINSGKTLFQVCPEDRGRLARAVFYMATMYMPLENGLAFDGIKGLTIVDSISYYNSECCMGLLSDLLDYAENTFVDVLEIQHNEVVYRYSEGSKNKQGNRNPYVDFPELVEYAFGYKKDMPGNLCDLTPSYVTLGVNLDDIYSYAVSK